jgi:DNA (cytosine-5)-methyltransferase 1
MRQKKKSTRRTSGPRPFIDLFSGAGGLTLGFSQRFGNGFSSVWANDFDESAATTYNLNFGDHCVPGDISNLLRDSRVKIPKADIVIGGPPCQGFSLLNRNRQSDHRKQLWRPFFEVVDRCGAEVFVMENVPQLLGSSEHGEILELAKRIGFSVVSSKLCAADFGVSQVRHRAFLVGCKFADPGLVFPPKKTHFNPRNGNPRDSGGYIARPKPWRTLRDAISDLPPPEDTGIRSEDPPLDLHFGRSPRPISIKRYRAIPKEGMNRFDLQRRVPELTPPCWIRKTTGGTDLFGRLWWDRPAYTIRTEFFKPEKGRYLHPVQHRPITHREAARFQSFPDDFRFFGSKIEIAKQIGNAVPPLLAAHVAKCIAKLFEIGAVGSAR